MMFSTCKQSHYLQFVGFLTSLHFHINFQLVQFTWHEPDLGELQKWLKLVQSYFLRCLWTFDRKQGLCCVTSLTPSKPSNNLMQQNRFFNYQLSQLKKVMKLVIHFHKHSYSWVACNHACEFCTINLQAFHKENSWTQHLYFQYFLHALKFQEHELSIKK